MKSIKIVFSDDIEFKVFLRLINKIRGEGILSPLDEGFLVKSTQKITEIVEIE